LIRAAKFLLMGALLALAAACGTQPTAPSLPQDSTPGPILQQSTETPPTRPPPAPGVAALDASKLPPFEGEKREVREALRGLPKVDRTVQPDDLWERIRRGFAMPDLDSPIVREKMAYYAARPEYLQRIFDRSKLYLYHIVEEIEKRGMPTELALLPMVESAFNPMAYSRAHASGLWQFIPGTGKRYELAQNWWYDARRDIVESTAAALEYLNNVYQMQGDWHLALASYNWGEGAVARAIAKNRARGLPTDYSHLTMPLETRQYVPKLQALKNIIRDPKPFGIVLDPIPNQPYFVAYDSVRDIDVQLAAKLAEMPVEEFVALNPGFSRPLIRAAVTPRIILPADKVDVFHANLAKYDEKSLVSWEPYYPRKGETLESIARKHGLSLAELKEVNGIPARSRALPSLLVVPVKGAASPGVRKLPIMYAPPIPVLMRKIFHTVRSGETLLSISRRYGVAVDDIKRWNHVGRVSTGQRLVLEVRAPVRGKAKRGKAKPKPRKKSAG